MTQQRVFWKVSSMQYGLSALLEKWKRAIDRGKHLALYSRTSLRLLIVSTMNFL